MIDSVSFRLTDDDFSWGRYWMEERFMYRRCLLDWHLPGRRARP